MATDSSAAWMLEHGAFVWRVLRHLGVPEQQLEDLSQEVFMVMFRQRAQFEGRSSERTWIYGICRNLAGNARRRQRRKPETLSEAVPELATGPEQGVELQRNRAQIALRAALSQLPQTLRMVFVLYELECMRMSEIASALELSVTTGYSKLRQARELVRSALIEAGIDDAELAEVG
jgi:RNA polymerase sigma-70 factor (ECF subfamily)